jgi:AraC-like DNA-binding protein
MGAFGLVAAGLVDAACTLGESYGIPRSELLYVAALEPREIRDPGARVSGDALTEIVSYLLERTGDRGLGIRFAKSLDLRTQGFWGYSFLSCLTLRQATDLLIRFQHLRHSSRLTFRIEGDWAFFERERDPQVPPGLEVIWGDAMLTVFCYNRRRWMPQATGEMRAWLSYAEEPHHRELRELVSGPVTFNAPFNRHCIPVWELDLQVGNHDPHLLSLAEAQLEQQSAQAARQNQTQDAAELVRNLMLAQLHEGVSIDRVARELHLSVRTLRRRLDALGVTFQRLLEEVRHRRAVEYLTHTQEAIESVAERLGYVDPSNFRRAFRRWTGLPPTAYRSAHAMAAARGSQRTQEQAKVVAARRPPRALP